jgi:hypothetical protein
MIKQYISLIACASIAPAAWIFGHMIQVQWIYERCGAPDALVQNTRLCADNALRLRWGGALMVAVFGLVYTLLYLPFKVHFQGDAEQKRKVLIKIALAFQVFFLSIFSLLPAFRNERFFLFLGAFFFLAVVFALRGEIRSLFPAVTPGSGTEREGDRFISGLFIFALVFHFCFAWAGFLNPIVDHHSWRQTQTALSSYYFVQEGFKIDYITPAYGKPWAIPMEFPIYQYICAGIVKITGFSLDQVSRIVSLLSFYISIFFIYRILQILAVPRLIIKLSLSLLLLAPLHIFFARSVFIETLTTMLGVTWLFAALKFFTQHKLHWLLIAGIFGTACGLSKVTTFIVMTVFMVAIFFHFREKPWKANFNIRSLLFFFSAACGIVFLPAAVAVAWVRRADSVKLHNPLIGDLWQSAALRDWNFGTIAQRLSIDFWERMLVTGMRDVLGYLGFFILIILIYSLIRRRSDFRYWVACAVLTFLSGPMIFSNLYYVHDYYFVACALFLLLALGIQIGSYYSTVPARIVPNVRYYIILPVIISMLGWYFDKYFQKQLQAQHADVDIGLAVKKLTRPQDILIIHGEGARPNIPYYAQRKAIINEEDKLNFDGKKMQTALKNAADENIGAVVLTGLNLWSEREKNSLVAKYAARYGFDTAPIEKIVDAEIFIKSLKKRH